MISFNTLRPRQMDAISQTTFSSAFYWMKVYELRLTIHWSLFLGVQLTIFQLWFRQLLGAVQATCRYRNQWWLVYRRIYASLSLNELIIDWRLLHVKPSYNDILHVVNDSQMTMLMGHSLTMHVVPTKNNRKIIMDDVSIILLQHYMHYGIHIVFSLELIRCLSLD